MEEKEIREFRSYICSTYTGGLEEMNEADEVMVIAGMVWMGYWVN